jgi:hypothetical protein
MATRADASPALGGQAEKVRRCVLNPWFDLTLKTVQLGLDAQSVIALRMIRLTSGGARAKAEMSRMVIEKPATVAEAQVAAAVAVVGGRNDHAVVGKALKVFSKRVRANKRRLSRR